MLSAAWTGKPVNWRFLRRKSLGPIPSPKRTNAGSGMLLHDPLKEQRGTCNVLNKSWITPDATATRCKQKPSPWRAGKRIPRKHSIKQRKKSTGRCLPAASQLLNIKLALGRHPSHAAKFLRFSKRRIGLRRNSRGLNLKYLCPHQVSSNYIAEQNAGRLFGSFIGLNLVSSRTSTRKTRRFRRRHVRHRGLRWGGFGFLLPCHRLF